MPSESPQQPSRRVEEAVFRHVMGHFPSGVAVITAHAQKRDFGTTASALTSLSLSPPMLLVCLNRDSETRKAITSTGLFGVNVLSEHQEHLAHRFAAKSPSKFEGLELSRSERCLAQLSDALAYLECTVAETAVGGTHTVFLAVVESAHAYPGAPLTYFRGRFGRLADDTRGPDTVARMSDGDDDLFGAEHVGVYEETAGERGYHWRGTTILLLSTRGRTTGQRRTMPLIHRVDGDRFIVVASRGGSPRNPSWYENLMAEPDAEIQVLRERIPVRASTAEGEERARLWSLMTEVWPAYDDYQNRTHREIPVVVLSRR
jgi:deazaflavin-dependent oxidoreductase (nitroreductase family)